MKTSIVVAFTAVIIMTVVPAVYDGQRRFRWGEDSQVAALAENLRSFPSQIGDWQITSDLDVDNEAEIQLQPIAIINRIYFNATHQRRVHVFLLLGPTGPTAVHTPDICFNSRDYQRMGERQSSKVDRAQLVDSTCYVTTFRSRDANRSYLRSWYAWTADGIWRSPSNPRYYFAGNRHLIKIQVVSAYADREEMEQDQVVQEFVADIEKTLRNHVF